MVDRKPDATTDEREVREVLRAADGATTPPWDLDVASVVRAAGCARRRRRRAQAALACCTAAVAVAVTVTMLLFPGPLSRQAGPASGPSLAPQEEIAPAFLDVLAPLDGDAQVRAREGADNLLVQRLTDAVGPCMDAAGYGEYAQLHVLEVQDFNTAHSELASPTKLETHGLVSIADPQLENVPAQGRQALEVCTAEGEAASAAAAIDRFKVFRDSGQNPFHGWYDTLRTEAASIAASDDANTANYRACFERLGVPADVAPDATQAVDSLIGDMNNRTNDFAPERVAAWQDGSGVLDADEGELARQAANCVRQFQELLTPRLVPARATIVGRDRETVLEGQRIFYEALGTTTFDPDAG